MPVHNFRLRKIRNLRRTRNIRGGGKQIILHHRPEECIGAEVLRLHVCHVHQFVPRPGFLAGLKFSGARRDNLPHATGQMEQ